MSNRLQNLISAMPDSFEAAIITSQPNRFYLLGCDTHGAGTLIVLRKNAYFIIDSRYIEIARKNIQGAEVILENVAAEQIAAIIENCGIKNVNIEDTASLARAAKIKADLPEDVNLITDNTLTNALEGMRKIKSADEIATIKKAQVITDACFEYILTQIKPGMREIDLALEMEMFMRKNGAKKLAFDTIFVAGANSSLPHGEPGNSTIKSGDFITIDFGANVDGYCTDMTRTIAVGSVSDEQRKVYDTVLKAQLTACENARGGMTGFDVDKIARDIITDAGYGENFGHGLGHSLGIEIHENPRFSPICKDVVPTGAVMTIEPGIYLAGKFGVRIEDTVVMGDSGVEILAKSPKELIIV